MVHSTNKKNSVGRWWFLSFLWFWSCSYASYNGDTLLMKWDARTNRSMEVSRQRLNTIIQAAQAMHDTYTLANAYRRMGILYQHKLRPDSAMFYYLKSLNLAASFPKLSSHASTCNQIGSLRYDLSDPAGAMYYMKKAYEGYLADTNYRGLADAGLNLAQVYVETGFFSLAEQYCLQSRNWRLRWVQKERPPADTLSLGSNYLLLSLIYTAQKKEKQASRYLTLAIDYLQEYGRGRQLIPALVQQGCKLLEAHQAGRAITVFREAYGYASALGSLKYLTVIEEHLSDAFAEEKRTDSSFYYLKRYATGRETLLRQSSILTAFDMNTRYEVQKKETELERQRQLNENKKKEELFLILLIGCLLVVLVVLLRSTRQRRKLERRESELKSANDMIRVQHAERERIARELHDRVGSMLSTVKLHFSAVETHMGEMIKQQGRVYEKALGLLDETYEEVRRISHDLDSGLLAEFGFRGAVLQLAQAIESTSHIKIMYFDNNLDPAVYQDVGTHLYRITQELLNNTIKYSGAGQVSVQLSHANNSLVYSYEDDGIGFDKKQLQKTQGIGYKNITNRVKKIKGHWHLDTSPGHGLNFIVEIPLHEKNRGNHSR